MPLARLAGLDRLRGSGRARYMYLRDALTPLGLNESALERNFHTLRDPGNHKLVAVLYTCVDDCLVDSDDKPEFANAVLAKAKTQLHMLIKEGSVSGTATSISR